MLGAGGGDHVGAAAGPAQNIGPKKNLFIFLNTTCIDGKAINLV
jgi:hypothetical protein